MIALIFKEAFRAIRRTPGTWAMNVLTLAIALGLTGLFATIAWRAHSAMQSLRENISMEAYFDPAISSEAASGITDHKIKPLPSIASFKFISREQALTDYATMSGEDVQSILGMNPLPASVRIRISDPTAERVKNATEKLRGIPGVADVRTDLALVQAMEQRSHALDRIALVAGSLLLLTALFFATLTSRFVLRTRQDAMCTLSMLGARQGIILGPLYIEAGLGGLAGGLLAAGILFGLQQSALSAIGDAFRMQSSREDTYVLAVCLAIAGCILGVVGSLGAVVFRPSKS